MSVKGRVVIEVMDDGLVGYVPDPALSRMEAQAAVLAVWRLVVGRIDLEWYRAMERQQAEEHGLVDRLEEGVASLPSDREQGEEP